MMEGISRLTIDYVASVFISAGHFIRDDANTICHGSGGGIDSDRGCVSLRFAEYLRRDN
jgi:hypothetical protein